MSSNKRNFTTAFSILSESSKRSSKRPDTAPDLDARSQQVTFDLDSDSDDGKTGGDEKNTEENDDEDSTELKLALLSSIHPHLPTGDLMELLLSCNGSVEEAALAATADRSSSPRKKTSTGPGMQSALSSYFGSRNGGSPTKKAPKPPIPFPLPFVPKGKTIHISTVEDVPYHSPCTIRAPFLPTQLATTLLQELLEEAKTFERPKFRLFERNVESPHTISLFVGNTSTAFMQKTDYLYNGTSLSDVRTFTPTMAKVAEIVEEVVREEIKDRIKNVYPGGKKLKYQMSPEKWRPTHAFVNCYDGGKESVGWHSDQLTYLGPRTVIASISLGVEREFRLRRVAPVPTDSGDDGEDDGGETKKDVDAPPASQEEIEADINSAITASRTSPWAELEGAVSLHLPHNSLVIMHAETQESYKHCIQPASAITPHPISGNKRINITYRFYREALHPSKTPKCHCKLPSILRTVQRKEDNMGRYFWMCHAGNAPDGTNCSFFEWAEFDSEGEPIWDDDEKVENS